MKLEHITDIPSFVRVTNKKRGAPPGELLHVGRQKIDEAYITIFSYNQSECEDKTVSSISELPTSLDPDKIHWINIVGLHDINIIKEAGKMFQLHSLLLEDVLNTGQRPKLEIYDDQLFIVLKMLHMQQDKKSIGIEQVSVVQTKNMLISFQEKPQDAFDPIRERLRNNKGLLRSSGTDYLAYRILDCVTDEYFSILDNLGEQIEQIEQLSFKKSDDEFISSVFQLKRQMLFVRKAVHPLRDVVLKLEGAESDLIESKTSPYFRDVHDHIVQIVESTDTFRDLVTNTLDTYLSITSYKMNIIMKVLTIVASIFIPLTFIAGIYGMNFTYMPELSWKYGYPAAWCIMILMTTGMIAYFKKKNWI